MTRSRAVRRILIAGLLGLFSVLVSGCSWSDLPRYGWPVGITPQAERMQYFWSASFTFALFIGAIVWGLMFWAFIVYRKRKNGPTYPKQTKENLPLELIYTFVPFLMVGALFYFTVTTENFVLENKADPDVTIDVTAFKWNWDFGYPGTTVPGGGEVHTIGNSEEVPILVLPVNKLVQYQLRSKDVIHSFWTIDFLFKRDVFPYPEQNQTAEHLPEHHLHHRGLRRPLRGTLRHVPQLDELRGTGRSAGRLRLLHRPSADHQPGHGPGVFVGGRAAPGRRGDPVLRRVVRAAGHHDLPAEHGPHRQVRDRTAHRG